MVWGSVKRILASGNMTVINSELEEFLKDKALKVFERYVKHTIEEEEKYREMGTILD